MKVRGSRNRYLPSRFARQRARYNRRRRQGRCFAYHQSNDALTSTYPTPLPPRVHLPLISAELNLVALLPPHISRLLQSGPRHKPTEVNQLAEEGKEVVAGEALAY